jgi:hypothetical protein
MQNQNLVQINDRNREVWQRRNRRIEEIIKNKPEAIPPAILASLVSGRSFESYLIDDRDLEQARPRTLAKAAAT